MPWPLSTFRHPFPFVFHLCFGFCPFCIKSNSYESSALYIFIQAGVAVCVCVVFATHFCEESEIISLRIIAASKSYSRKNVNNAKHFHRKLAKQQQQQQKNNEDFCRWQKVILRTRHHSIPMPLPSSPK